MPTKQAPPAAQADPTPAERRAGGPDAENPRVLAAARSNLLWEMTAAGASSHFRLSNPQVTSAKSIALATRPGDVAAAQRRREHTRRLNRVVRAEAKYPLVHRKLSAGTSFGACADDYQLSRMRACQLKHEFDALVADRGNPTHESVLREVEKAARKVAAE